MKRNLKTALGLALLAGLLAARPARAEDSVTTDKFDQLIRLIIKGGERTTRLEDRTTKVEDRVSVLEQKANGSTPSYVPAYSPPSSAPTAATKQVAYRGDDARMPTEVADLFTAEEKATLAAFFERFQRTGSTVPQTDAEWDVLIKMMRVAKHYR